MPSGAYSTSHGDSWILALMFWWFIEHLRNESPDMRRKIDLWYGKGKIFIVVYGDDHIIGAHKEVAQWINEVKFASWLFKFLDMEVRDINVKVPVLSVAGNCGGVLVKGVVFLKRYLIERPPHFNANTAPIVAYRPTWTYYYKLPFGSGAKRSIYDTILSCIGNAYDTFGTNVHAFNFLSFIHAFCMTNPQVRGMSAREVYTKMIASADRSDVTSVVRKMNVTKEQLEEGFPTLDNLARRNVHDSEKIKYQVINVD